jgi:hypothetical protein
MQLEDKLRICLLALESRYPEHVVSINTSLLGAHHNGACCWSASDMLEYLEHAAPMLLDEMALLIVNVQQSDIYLVSRSEEIPALVVHCQGRVPERQPSRPLIERIMSEQLWEGPTADSPQPQQTSS